MSSTALTDEHESLLAPGQDLDAYARRVGKIPVLTVEEERELALRMYDHQDEDAKRYLIQSHLRFVMFIAQSYRGYGLPQADLIQEGNIGLLKAIERFDPYVGVRLVSFAIHWIRSEMHEYILRNWRIVKIATTKAQRKLFFNLRASKTRLNWLNADETQKLADTLNVSIRDVQEMEKRLSNQDVAFDAPSDNQDDDDSSFVPADYLADQRFNPEQLVSDTEEETYRYARLEEALQQLDERSAKILRQRWMGDAKVTLSTLAKQYKVSTERVRQIEQAAMRKIRSHLMAVPASA